MYFYPSFRRQHYILQLTHVRLFPSSAPRATISLLILSSPSREPPAYCRDYTRVEFVWHSTERRREEENKNFSQPSEKKLFRWNWICIVCWLVYYRCTWDWGRTRKKSATISWWCCTIKFNFNLEIPSPTPSAWNVRPLRIDQLLFTSKTTTAAAETRVAVNLQQHSLILIFLAWNHDVSGNLSRRRSCNNVKNLRYIVWFSLFGGSHFLPRHVKPHH